MIPIRDVGRRLIPVVLAIVITGLNVAVPLLDRGPGHDLPAFEPVGSSSSCMFGHDHGICTQHGANPLAVTALQQPVGHSAIRRIVAFSGDIVIPHDLHSTLYNSRAPPAV